ncbi:MAG TPA: HEAT repeat domain-containing protein [Planctomycetota bacterium]|nr:HEAT repeat domain-containing protein [Planctomycetota bacterium]
MEALIASTDDYDTLWGAACALEAMRAEAAPALNTILKLPAHESGRVAGAAASAIGHIGVRALPHLIGILKNGTPRSKEFACDALGRLGPKAKKALPLLARLREDPACEGDFRAWQILAAAEISLDKKLAPALLVMSDGKDIDLPIRAKTALEQMDLSRDETVNAVQRELADIGDSDPEMAAALLKVLRRFRR